MRFRQACRQFPAFGDLDCGNVENKLSIGRTSNSQTAKKICFIICLWLGKPETLKENKSVKTIRFLLAIILGLSLNIPAFAQGNTGVLTYLQGGAKTLNGSANQLYGMNTAGTLPEMKTLQGSGSIHVTGSTGLLTISSALNVVTQNSAFNAAVGTLYLITGNCTTTLPTAVGIAGASMDFVISTSATTLTFNTTSSQTINSHASGALAASTQYEFIHVVSNGTNWVAGSYTVL